MPDTGNVLLNIADVMPDSAIVEHDGAVVEQYFGNVMLRTADVMPDCVDVGHGDAIVGRNRTIVERNSGDVGYKTATPVFNRKGYSKKITALQQ